MKNKRRKKHKDKTTKGTTGRKSCTKMVSKSDIVSKERNWTPSDNYNSISKIYPTAYICACDKSYINKVIHCSIMANRLEEI